VLTWVDRTGKDLGTIGRAAHYAGLSLSHRADTVIATVCESIDCEDTTTTNYVRTYNLRMLRTDGGEVRLTSDQAVAATPVWSPRDDEIIFGSTRSGHMELYRRRIGSATDALLLPAGPDRGATSWSADGRYVAYTELDPGTGFDIWILDLRRGEPFVFRRTNASETGAAFSPNGKWIAYNADNSGKPQVYVAPFSGRPTSPTASQGLRISSESGMLPAWREDSSELYYYDGQKVMAVSIRISAGKLVPEAPRMLFRLRRLARMGAAYAPSPEGNRFLILSGSATVDTPITVRIR
jgi:Tol biopolymer transport system component